MRTPSFRNHSFIIITASALAALVACSSDSSGNSGDSVVGNDGGSSSNDGSSAANDASSPTDAAVPVGAPAAPTKLRMVLQGQDSASQTSSPPTPKNPDRLDIAWTAATAGAHPVDHYNVYRSTDGTTFSAYAKSSSTSYSDTKATGCVNGTAGATAPYYTAKTYWYKVSAVDNAGLEGSQSSTQSFVLYENGKFNWGGDFDFGGLTTDYQDTTGGANGDTMDIKTTVNGAYGGWLPYSGNLVTEWNMWGGAFGNLELDLKPTASGQTWNLNAVRVGDVPIYDDTGAGHHVDLSAYGPAPVAGAWGHYKIPLADILTDYGPSGAGPAVVEYAIYKFGLQDQTGKASNTWYIDNVAYTPK